MLFVSMKTSEKQRRRVLLGAVVLFGLIVGWAAPATASISVRDYMQLRADAMSGNKAAEARWRFYVIGLMDGIQAVKAPSEAAGAKLHFCIPDDLPLSPKYLDAFVQKAIDRMSLDGTLKSRIDKPMAVLVALELAHEFPCP